MVGLLTARCIIDVVVGHCVHDETCYTDDDCDQAKREHATEGNLLPLAQFETVDDEEWESKYYVIVSSEAVHGGGLRIQRRSVDQFKAQLIANVV